MPQADLSGPRNSGDLRAAQRQQTSLGTPLGLVLPEPCPPCPLYWPNTAVERRRFTADPVHPTERRPLQPLVGRPHCTRATSSSVPPEYTEQEPPAEARSAQTQQA